MAPCRPVYIFYVLLAILAGPALAAEPNYKGILISQLSPDPRGGQAYRLRYQVPLPIDTFWRFKTDFDNAFVEENRYILEHRMVRRAKDVVITEDRYSSMPDTVFRWRTQIFAEQHRMTFELINANDTSHKFHYGFIQLMPSGTDKTQVEQVAYFDFFGAGLWSRYPWSGGMRSFLEYTAHWEKQTALRWSSRNPPPGGEE